MQTDVPQIHEQPLLPCPFCGAPAAWWTGGFGERFITCEDLENCGGRFGSHVWVTRDSEQVLIAKWNTRAPLSTQEESGYDNSLQMRQITAMPDGTLRDSQHAPDKDGTISKHQEDRS